MTGPATEMNVNRRLWVMALLTLALAGATVLAWRVSDTMDATARRASSPPLAVDYQAALAQRQCLTAEARRVVPKGARVYAGPAGADAQELIESVQSWATVTAPSKAQWTLVLDQTGGPCYGEGVHVVRR
ncbi:MAG TPA: hypothetical protein VG435_20905 [Acidimicrobiales bacterium]|jgi:hypothetical protein|nr:hypothetical protein [Acidimicrobiales bacterium]